VFLSCCESNPFDEIGCEARLTLQQWHGFLQVLVAFVEGGTTMGSDIRFLPRIAHDRTFVLEYSARHPECALPLQTWRDAASAPAVFPVLVETRKDEVPVQVCAEIAIAAEETGAVLACIFATPKLKARLAFDKLVITAIAVHRPWMLTALKRECPVWDEGLRQFCDRALEWFGVAAVSKQAAVSKLL
jgi:hypothetical protein